MPQMRLPSHRASSRPICGRRAIRARASTDSSRFSVFSAGEVRIDARAASAYAHSSPRLRGARARGRHAAKSSAWSVRAPRRPVAARPDAPRHDQLQHRIATQRRVARELAAQGALERGTRSRAARNPRRAGRDGNPATERRRRRTRMVSKYAVAVLQAAIARSIGAPHPAVDPDAHCTRVPRRAASLRPWRGSRPVPASDSNPRRCRRRRGT